MAAFAKEKRGTVWAAFLYISIRNADQVKALNVMMVCVSLIFGSL